MKSVGDLNKRTVRLFVETVVNEGRLDLIDELIAADYTGHLSCADIVVAGPDGVRQLVSSRRRTHPGLHVTIKDQVAEDDLVVTRWQATMTARSDRSAAPPGRRIPCYAGISISRLIAGKLVDSRTECTNFIEERGPAG